MCHEILGLYFFWLNDFFLFEPIWAPDKQAKVFSNSVSILPRYWITKAEKFDSVVCITPRRQNFRLSKSKFGSSNLQYYFHINIFRHHREIAFLNFGSKQTLGKLVTLWCDAHGMMHMRSFLKIKIHPLN